jgi:hypothetical protein
VTEVWKGTLSSGESLFIPELGEENKRISSDKNNKVVVSGQNIVLFLNKASLLKRIDKQWLPASSFHEIHVSAVWIEKNIPYAFVQIFNPGPTVLSQQGSSKENFKKSVLRIKQIQESLNNIKAIPDYAERAKKASEYINSDIYYARYEVVSILVDCKSFGTPILLSMLDDTSNSNLKTYIVEALKKTAIIYK